MVISTSSGGGWTVVEGDSSEDACIVKRQIDIFSVILENIQSQNFSDKVSDAYSAKMGITYNTEEIKALTNKNPLLLSYFTSFHKLQVLGRL